MYVESIMLHEQNYREVDEMSCRFENKKTHIEAWRRRFYNNLNARKIQNNFVFGIC